MRTTTKPADIVTALAATGMKNASMPASRRSRERRAVMSRNNTSTTSSRTKPSNATAATYMTSTTETSAMMAISRRTSARDGATRSRSHQPPARAPRTSTRPASPSSPAKCSAATPAPTVSVVASRSADSVRTSVELHDDLAPRRGRGVSGGCGGRGIERERGEDAMGVVAAPARRHGEAGSRERYDGTAGQAVQHEPGRLRQPALETLGIARPRPAQHDAHVGGRLGFHLAHDRGARPRAHAPVDQARVVTRTVLAQVVEPVPTSSAPRCRTTAGGRDAETPGRRGRRRREHDDLALELDASALGEEAKGKAGGEPESGELLAAAPRKRVGPRRDVLDARPQPRKRDHAGAVGRLEGDRARR